MRMTLSGIEKGTGALNVRTLRFESDGDMDAYLSEFTRLHDFVDVEQH